SPGQDGMECDGFNKESFIRSFKGMFDENNSSLPSGLHLGVPAPYLNLVSWMASPPSRDNKNICGLPSARRTKAICLPSGLQAPWDDPSFAVNCFGDDTPSVFTIQTWFTYLLSHLESPSGSIVVTVKTALVASLERLIPLIDFIFSMSVTLTGSLVCACKRALIRRIKQNDRNFLI